LHADAQRYTVICEEPGSSDKVAQKRS